MKRERDTKYRYAEEFHLEDHDQVRFKAVSPDEFTSASHTIIRPGTSPDLHVADENEIMLGNGKLIKPGPLIIESEVLNTDDSNKWIKIKYYINNKAVIYHHRPKGNDHVHHICIIIDFI